MTTSTTSWKEQQIALREEQILQLAWDLLAENGNFTVGEITKELGIARGTFYLHFGNKEEICAYLLARRYQLLVVRLSSIEKTTDPLQDLSSLIQVYFNFCIEDRRAYTVEQRCRQILLTNGSTEINQDYQNRLQTLRSERLNVVGEFIGRLLPDASPQELLMYLGAGWGMLKGAAEIVVAGHMRNEITSIEQYCEIVTYTLVAGFEKKIAEDSNKNK